MHAHLMEDHRDAYFFWQQLEVADAVCVHVDAHLDVSNFKVPATSLHRSEIHCGNFLLHSIREGQVRHLIWVVPPHLLGDRTILEWLRIELRLWMRLTTADFLSLRLEQGRVEGTLAGARFTVCTADRLPPLEPDAPLLLDIDIDYFLAADDELWQTPAQLRDQLGQLHPLALTVAYSVSGGYTPLWQRDQGDRTLEIFADRSVIPEPPGYQAAELLRQAHRAGEDHEGPVWEQAARLDPSYTVQPPDVASYYMLRLQGEACRKWLERLDRPAALYLGGVLAFRLGDDNRAAQDWEALLAEELDDSTRAHAWELHGRALARAGQTGRALESFHQALRLDPREPALLREEARCLTRLDRDAEAARVYRKAIARVPEELASLEARIDLANVYLRLGQLTLAQAECHALLEGTCPDSLKLEAQMVSMRLAHKQMVKARDDRNS